MLTFPSREEHNRVNESIARNVTESNIGVYEGMHSDTLLSVYTLYMLPDVLQMIRNYYLSDPSKYHSLHVRFPSGIMIYARDILKLDLQSF